MSQLTAIEWTDLSWNPVHGCSKISPGCAHYYAADLSLRRPLTRKPWTPANAAENVRVKPHKLREPLSKRQEWQGLGAAAAAAGKTEGKLVFVNSMSDLFHEQVPDEFIAQVFGVMANADHHTFQVLTKRPERMHDLLNNADWWFDVRWHAANAAEERGSGGMPYLTETELDRIEREMALSNVWLGVSIENRRYVHRADLLRQTPAAVRFISAEPLLGPLLYDARDERFDTRTGERWPDARFPVWEDGYEGAELDLTDIDWLIAGGESGPKHRPMRVQWVRDLLVAAQTRCSLCTHGVGMADEWHHDCEPGYGYLRCERVAFFFKQWGGARPGGNAFLNGREWREFPVVAR